MVEYVSREVLESLSVGSDPDLSTEEKETTITVDNDREYVRIHTDIPTHIKWILSIPQGKVVHFRSVSDKLVGITADIPKGYLKLQATNRKSQTNGSMVSYGKLT
jgi:hypothetical protein